MSKKPPSDPPTPAPKRARKPRTTKVKPKARPAIRLVDLPAPVIPVLGAQLADGLRPLVLDNAVVSELEVPRLVQEWLQEACAYALPGVVQIALGVGTEQRVAGDVVFNLPIQPQTRIAAFLAIAKTARLSDKPAAAAGETPEAQEWNIGGRVLRFG